MRSFKISLLIILLLLVNSCKSKVYIPVTEYKTEYLEKIKRDSIYQLDSIFIKEYLKNDTVFITKNSFKYKYLDKLIIDSIIIKDSIPYKVEVIKEIEVNKISGFQNFQIWLGRILLIILCGFLFFKIKF